MRARLAGRDERECVVVDERRVVLGFLGPEQLDGARDGDVGDAMDPAPDTVRPSAAPKDVLDYMGARGTRVVVTTPEGELIGVVHRPAVERCLAETRGEAESPRFPCATGARGGAGARGEG